MIDLSVILGTKNRPHLIPKFIENVKESAKDKSIEIIICNAGGKIDACDSKVLPPTGKGLTADYNLCFNQAVGEYTVWLSDDILCIDDALSKVVDLIRTHNEKDVAGFIIKQRNDIPSYAYVFGKLCPVVSCINTATFRKLGFWNTDYPIYGSDIELISKVYKNGGIAFKSDCMLSHSYVFDETKKDNIENNKDDTSMFYFFNARFGKLSDSIFPKILIIDDGGNVEKLKQNIKTFALNIDFYVFQRSKIPANYQIYDVIISCQKQQNKLYYPLDKDLGEASRYVKQSFLKEILKT